MKKIDYQALKTICLAKIEWFEQFGVVETTPVGNYVYKDNNAKVLAVAHLDSVHSLDHFYVNRIDGQDIVYASTLDDRLGAYVILDLLPKYGLIFDILLTDGEERGLTTARYFETDKKYNWMFSFDRHGRDVVMYDYETKGLKKKLKKSGFQSFDPGLYSDISELENLGCRGMNIGTGYQDEHTKRAYAEMNVLQMNVANFLQFWRTYSTTYLPYTPTPIETSKKWWRNIDDNYYTSMDYRGFYQPVDKTEPYSRKCVRCHAYYNKVSMVDGVCSDCAYEFEECHGCGAIVKFNELSTTGFCPQCQHMISG